MDYGFHFELLGEQFIYYEGCKDEEEARTKLEEIARAYCNIYNSGIGEILYIGDNLKNDVLGPSKAGIKTVWVNRKNVKRKSNDAKPDFIINNLSQLEKLKLFS